MLMRIIKYRGESDELGEKRETCSNDLKLGVGSSAQPEDLVLVGAWVIDAQSQEGRQGIKV